jgi:hypothetical protein
LKREDAETLARLNVHPEFVKFKEYLVHEYDLLLAQLLAEKDPYAVMELKGAVRQIDTLLKRLETSRGELERR